MVEAIFAPFFHKRTRSLAYQAINRFCKKSSVYSQLTRLTDGQTDKRKSDLNSGSYYITLATTRSLGLSDFTNNFRITTSKLCAKKNWADVMFTISLSNVD